VLAKTLPSSLVTITVNLSPSNTFIGSTIMLNSFNITVPGVTVEGQLSFGVSSHEPQKLFMQVCVPVHPMSVLQLLLAPLVHSPQDCVSDGLFVIVPQAFKSEQVLVWVPLMQELHAIQLQFSMQGQLSPIMSMHDPQVLFAQVWFPPHPRFVVQDCVVVLMHSPQDCVSDGWLIVVPQSLSSMHVLVCVPFKQVLHPVQVHDSLQTHSVVW